MPQAAPASRTTRYRIKRLRRLLHDHPSVVDAAFVTMTLGTAALLWRCGW